MTGRNITVIGLFSET